MRELLTSVWAWIGCGRSSARFLAVFGTVFVLGIIVGACVARAAPEVLVVPVVVDSPWLTGEGAEVAIVDPQGRDPVVRLRLPAHYPVPPASAIRELAQLVACAALRHPAVAVQAPRLRPPIPVVILQGRGLLTGLLIDSCKTASP